MIKKIGLKFIYCLFFSLTISNAFSFSEINCWENDCFHNGWTAQDSVSGNITDYQCYRNSCLSSGWIIGGTKESTYTQCKDRGCFIDGWFELERSTHDLIREVRCNEEAGVSNCLIYGWQTFEKGAYYPTKCIENDCEHFGWKSILPGYQQLRVECKNSNCFNEGWRSFR